MNCPACQNRNTKVVDSRMNDGGFSIRRRRHCDACEYRFTTIERIQRNNLTVTKKDGDPQPYDRSKLERSIQIACAKRPIMSTTIKEKLDALEETWAHQKDLTTTQIGEDVMAMLKGIDEVAFVRFASVYQSFADLESFHKALKSLG